jgi:hypothetical protein
MRVSEKTLFCGKQSTNSYISGRDCCFLREEQVGKNHKVLRLDMPASKNSGGLFSSP